MPDQEQPRSAFSADPERLARLEARLARLEAHLGLGEPAAGSLDAPQMAVESPVGDVLADPVATIHSEDELEFEVGQNWFAVVGIVVLTIGAGFMLALPYARLPALLPALAGSGVAALLLAGTQFWRQTLAGVAGPVSGAAMTLLFFSALRLFFPETHHALEANSLAGRGVLLVVSVVNILLAWHRRSQWLMGLALVMGGAAAVVAGGAWFALPMLLLLAAVATTTGRNCNWPAIEIAAVPVVFGAYLLWALGNPLRGGGAHFVTEPVAAPLCLLALVAILALGPWWRGEGPGETPRAGIAALLNCGLGYGAFLLHTVVAFRGGVALLHAVAFVVFLGLAAGFWLRQGSRVATFFYAMTGYAALTAAIFKASAAPAVFVWLSAQSLVVVATAVWFRSRFIVVANFLIYVAVVLGYVFVVQRETGISLGFGVVALLSARILNWQKDRLELKTALMRNAYLIGAFLVFPYALYHLVSAKYVAIAWVGLAVGYYSLNALIQNQKYRWMGHATLLLTTCYLVVVGTRSFEPVYRVLSFLVLGTALLMVSVVFTRLRKRRGAIKEDTAGATASNL